MADGWLVMRDGEKQKHFVRRILKSRGHISVQECLYDLVEEGGKKRAITRLAAIVHELRHSEGMNIAESSPGHHTSTYTLVARDTLFD